MHIQRLGSVHCHVGEGPVWDTAEQALYFVDITQKLLWRYEPSSERFKTWQMPSMIGSLALRASGGALVALQDGFHHFDFATGATRALCNPQADDRTQFNDGKVDALGRFVCGSQPRSLQDMAPLGSLFRLNTDLTATCLDGGFGITNGPCWSPDSRTFYFSDSLPKTIFAYDYDLQSGSVSNRRGFATTDEFGGIPDGATVDSDANLWVSVCGGGKIVCFTPSGQVARVVDVPARWVSSVMFGGPALDQLYFTSIDAAAVGMAPKRGPDDGCLFVIDGLGATGLPEHRFGA
ncbi:MAG TPA: SMP-30/gluconolactonase/LRE family protein [Steroidobacteraceae bacterium]|nr:SMP-30/gluconolactonase/LRE family protein [Steroidobacteraceae bacterium]